jgi:uncharacterized membrane protein
MKHPRDAAPVKPIEILQGKWLGHPAHPALVHLPLGLWLGAAVIDVLAAFDISSAALVHLGLYAVGLGLASLVLVVPTGIADWLGIKPGKPARKLGTAHALLNVAAAIVFGANFIVRLNALDELEPIPSSVVLLSVIGAALLLVSGYLGSLLAFDYGIGVARMSKDKWRKEAERGGSNVPAKE